MEIKYTTIRVKLNIIRRFKELFSVHPRETYNDILERAINDGTLYCCEGGINNE